MGGVTHDDYANTVYLAARDSLCRRSGPADDALDEACLDWLQARGYYAGKYVDRRPAVLDYSAVLVGTT